MLHKCPSKVLTSRQCALTTYSNLETKKSHLLQVYLSNLPQGFLFKKAHHYLQEFVLICWLSLQKSLNYLVNIS